MVDFYGNLPELCLFLDALHNGGFPATTSMNLRRSLFTVQPYFFIVSW